MAALLLFIIALAVDVATTFWCAARPLQACLHHETSIPATFKEVLDLYSWKDSNLDVVAANLVKVLLLLLIVPICASQRRSEKACRGGIAAVQGVCWAAALLVLVKAMVVAVAGAPLVWPDCATGKAGLLYTFVAISVALLSSLVEGVCGSLLLQHCPPAKSEMRADSEPLLGSPRAPSEEQAHQGSVLMELCKMSMPDLHFLGLAFTAGIAAALFQACIPHYTGNVVDELLQNNYRGFTTAIKLLFLSSLACAVFSALRGSVFTMTTARLNMRLRKGLFASLLSQEAGFFDTTRTGDITSRLSADTSTVADQVSLNMNIFVRSLTQAVILLVFMVAASWRLTVLTFIMIPIIVCICKVYGFYLHRLSKEVQTTLAEANIVAEEVVSSMSTVKAHAAEASSKLAYAQELGRYFQVVLKQCVAYAIYMTLSVLLPNSVAALVLFVGGNLVFNGHMRAGSLVSFMLYQQSLLASFQIIGDVFSALTQAVGAADKVVRLIHREPEMPAAGSYVPTRFEGRVELRDVVLYYPSRPSVRVLDSLSLTVQPGEVVALVGSSGSGKSSIIKLIERLYEPLEGQIKLDGVELSLYEPHWLRQRVALVSQEPVLFGRSIRRNIIFGLEQEDGFEKPPSEGEIVEAAKQANAHDFIMSLPDGYDTQCGEKGLSLSGGQKQRIALARALVRMPAVLLLDEATSALDAESEAVVQEALERSMKDRTVIIVAHRLSSIQHADRIVVVSEGQVKEMGQHEELMNRNGVYSSFVRRQLTRVDSSTASLSSR